MTPEQERQRGQDAKRLLEEPLLVEAFSTLEQEIIDKWKTAPARDVDGREKLWTMLHLLQRTRAHLESVMASGRLAEATLAQRAKALLGRNASL